jgi:stearoyl-CoA desaturase (delta-9 desaturase)
MSQPAPTPTAATQRPSINYPSAILFAVTTLAVFTVVPWYFWAYSVSAAAWIFAALVMGATGMSITAGYHRLWSHRAYQAHWTLRVLLMLFGAMALQNSILSWATMHRVHHKNVDDIDGDPYSIRRGFWYAHMGWMLRNYPAADVDLTSARDLQADPIVMFQHRHYVAVALGMNILFPLAVGALFGDAWGFLLLGGLMRLVLNHHFTFFINSAAHSWGRRPYTTANTARDNDLLALVTFGEGYHNFHHLFQWDYRNGIRWWHFDPTKWMIWTLSWVGMTRDLRRVPEFKIRRALLERQFEKAQERMNRCQGNCEHSGSLAALQVQLQSELDAFKATLAEWSHLQGERIDTARRQLANQWDQSDLKRRLTVREQSLKLQQQRVQLLYVQTAAAIM